MTSNARPRRDSGVAYTCSPPLSRVIGRISVTHRYQSRTRRFRLQGFGLRRDSNHRMAATIAAATITSNGVSLPVGIGSLITVPPPDLGANACFLGAFLFPGGPPPFVQGSRSFRDFARARREAKSECLRCPSWKHSNSTALVTPRDSSIKGLSGLFGSFRRVVEHSLRVRIVAVCLASRFPPPMEFVAARPFEAVSRRRRTVSQQVPEFIAGSRLRA
jgi:hypothetical protein